MAASNTNGGIRWMLVFEDTEAKFNNNNNNTTWILFLFVCFSS